jgi:integrase
MVCRLARLEGSPPPRRVPQQRRSRCTPAAHEGRIKPQAKTGSIARAASEYQQAQKHNPNTQAALRSLVAAHGGQSGHQLTAEKVQTCCATWAEFSQHTRSTYSKCLRRFLRWLEEIGGAPLTISRAVPRIHQPEARATTATDTERDQLLAAAEPDMRFFLRLCGDLGIRHRTAARMTLESWHPLTHSITFTTKGNVNQSLPVTTEIEETLNSLPATSARNVPIIALLHTGRAMGRTPRMLKRWWKLKQRLGLRDELRIHDLRRTCAEDVWEATHDLRLVQAQLGHRSPTTTARYLANKVKLQDLEPVLNKVEAMRAARRKTPPAEPGRK